MNYKKKHVQWRYSPVHLFMESCMTHELAPDGAAKRNEKVISLPSQIGSAGRRSLTFIGCAFIRQAPDTHASKYKALRTRAGRYQGESCSICALREG